MKNSKSWWFTIGVVVGGFGAILFVTNPPVSSYEEFATLKLANYLKDNVCPQAPRVFDNFLQRQCLSLVDVSQPQMKNLIARTTKRYNYIFFSIYKTDLTISPALPSYHFETLGALGNFYIYQAESAATDQRSFVP